MKINFIFELKICLAQKVLETKNQTQQIRAVDPNNDNSDNNNGNNNDNNNGNNNDNNGQQQQ